MSSFARPGPKPRYLLPLLAAAACAPDGELKAEPASLDWGEVDFMSEQPDGGYDAKTLSITNVGDGDVEASIPGFDFDHFCVEGFSEVPVSLGVLPPGASYVLTIGVCAYDAEGGERDTLVSDEIVVVGDNVAESLAVPWSFTPVLVFED